MLVFQPLDVKSAIWAFLLLCFLYFRLEGENRFVNIHNSVPLRDNFVMLPLGCASIKKAESAEETVQ